MIDYTELPKDGVRFEQLVRELYIREGFDVKWTGNRSRPSAKELKTGLDVGECFLAQCSYERAQNAYRTAA